MRIVVVPDTQFPYHDERAFTAILDYIKQSRPDQVWCVGDWMDSPQPSRWNKGMAGEYSNDLQNHFDVGQAALHSLRVAARRGTPIFLRKGNHDERVETYIRRYAPALSGLRALDYAALIGAEEASVTVLDRPVEIVRGWVLAHGHEGSLNRVPGSTAMSLARKIGKSVVCGHTHKLAIQHDHSMLNGRISRYLYGVEAGHVMDPRKAQYLAAGAANWQPGFVELNDHGGKFLFPRLFTIHNGQIG